MKGQHIRIVGPTQRDFALECVRKADIGWIVTVKPENRTQAQNRFMWPSLKAISDADPIGQGYADWEYKLVIMDALYRFQCESAGMEPGQRLRMMQGTDGGMFPSTEGRSSLLSKSDFSDLIMIMKAYADRHGIALPEREMEWSETA